MPPFGRLKSRMTSPPRRFTIAYLEHLVRSVMFRSLNVPYAARFRVGFIRPNRYTGSTQLDEVLPGNCLANDNDYGRFSPPYAPQRGAFYFIRLAQI